VRGERRRDDNREREVAEISGSLKGLAKELGIPIMVISQLNRETAKDGSRPTIANLRESGAIEQDADIVCLLADPRDAGADGDSGTQAGTLDVLIAKNRHGMTDELKLTWIRKYTRFEDYFDAGTS
jgi:replicative DNA helicase